MGIEFRGSEYKRDVSLGKRTVKDGEAVALWNRHGEHRQVIGPRLVRLFFSTIRFLDKKKAGPNEYLRVELTSGTIEHLRGPITLYENPVIHSRVQAFRAITLLSASDCIVVHRQADTAFDNTSRPSGLSNEAIQRVIIRGPNTYYPGPRETVLNMPSENSQDDNRVPRSRAQQQAQQEQQADQCVFHLASRSWNMEFPFGSGKTKGAVRLAFRFFISDIEAMLDSTTNLMTDLHDAVTADLSNVATSTSAATTLEGLNTFDFFPVLLSRSAAMGVTMETVSFRGYEPSPENRRAEEAVKEMQAQMARTAMMAEQEEKRISADIAARQARLSMENELEEAVLAGKQARLVTEKEFNQKQQQCAADLERSRLEAHLEYHRLVNDESMRVLKGLKDLGADITKLLCEGDRSSLTDTTGTKDERPQRKTGRGITGREALLKTSPALNDWFSAPDAAGMHEEEKVGR